MPNHVTTIFTLESVSGDDLSKAQDVFLNDKRVVDFNKIVPMPACLKDFNPHSGITTRAELALGLLQEPSKDPKDISDLTVSLHFSNAMRDATRPIDKEDIAKVCRAMSNFAECGYTNWYDWCNDTWQTKWNAYAQPEGWPEDTTEFRFETAWSHPVKIMQLLSERVGDVKISVAYADEDTGSNCGKYVLRDGHVIEEDIAPHYCDMSEEEKKKWCEFAFKLTHPDEDPRSCGYDENWVYSDAVLDAYEAQQSA